jgi:hypothetical protein
MDQMFQVALAVIVAFSMTACGGGVCERIEAADTKFFAGTSECTSTEGGVTISISRSRWFGGNAFSASSCNMSISKCTSAENTLLDAYAKCIEAAPACTAGGEKAAVDANRACTLQLVNPTRPDYSEGTSKLSAECGAAFK